jgi:hypothetical protein
MANGKQKVKRAKATKVWKLLNGTYKKKINREDVEWLIAAIQQDIYWDDRDQQTFQAIQDGKIDWSGDVRKHRKPRKHIRKRS